MQKKKDLYIRKSLSYILFIPESIFLIHFSALPAEINESALAPLKTYSNLSDTPHTFSAELAAVLSDISILLSSFFSEPPKILYFQFRLLLQSQRFSRCLPPDGP